MLTLLTQSVGIDYDYDDLPDEQKTFSDDGTRAGPAPRDRRHVLLPLGTTVSKILFSIQ